MPKQWIPFSRRAALTRESRFLRSSTLGCGLRTWLALLSVWLTLTPAAMAARRGRARASDQLYWGLQLDGYSAYVWRGKVLVDDWVGQAGLTSRDGRWTLEAWTNMDWTDIRDQKRELTDLRLATHYLRQVPNSPWYLGFGYIYYRYPALNLPSTQEVYASLQRTDLMFKPKVTVFRDVEQSDTTYATLELSGTYAPPMLAQYKTMASIRATLSYGDKKFNEINFNRLNDGLTDFTITLDLPLRRPTWGYSIVPSISYMKIKDDEIVKASGVDDEFWWGGVSLVKRF